MSDSWFKPKTYGIGATPSNWKGWAAIGVLGLVILVLVTFMVLLPALRGEEPAPGQVLAFIGIETLAIVVFLVVAKKKTDGPWQWSWKSPPKN